MNTRTHARNPGGGGRTPRSSRRAFILVLVIATSFSVLGFAVVMAGMGLVEWGRDRQRALEVETGQILDSARAWARMNAAELERRECVELPADDLVRPPGTARATLRLSEAPAGKLVECSVTLTRAGRPLTRQALWPFELPAPD